MTKALLDQKVQQSTQEPHSVKACFSSSEPFYELITKIKYFNRYGVLGFWGLLLAAVPEGPDLRNEAAGQRAAGGGGLLDGHRHLEAGVGTRRAGENQMK